jgi:Asp-tRNA(Asn)/Glu-tRNA(Gln) amidotransferase A subunit family amidase
VIGWSVWKTYCGQPAISIPVAERRRPPKGLQIVGRRLADATVLALAAAYGRIHPQGAERCLMSLFAVAG